mmetsp:Transcript_34253/g.82483  ORF Transcript_34253/g.82483 Transcript_34253/m.82483 type:complete len:87 (-) Transcript_34253:1117-1377(-)
MEDSTHRQTKRKTSSIILIFMITALHTTGGPFMSIGNDDGQACLLILESAIPILIIHPTISFDVSSPWAQKSIERERSPLSAPSHL